MFHHPTLWFNPLEDHHLDTSPSCFSDLHSHRDESLKCGVVAYGQGEVSICRRHHLQSLAESEENIRKLELETAKLRTYENL